MEMMSKLASDSDLLSEEANQQASTDASRKEQHPQFMARAQAAERRSI